MGLHLHALFHAENPIGYAVDFDDANALRQLAGLGLLGERLPHRLQSLTPDAPAIYRISRSATYICTSQCTSIEEESPWRVEVHEGILMLFDPVGELLLVDGGRVYAVRHQGVMVVMRVVLYCLLLAISPYIGVWDRSIPGSHVG